MAEQAPRTPAEPGRAASGPALMQQLLELRQEFDELATEARQHWSKDEQRMQLIDQFINPQLNLEGILRQMVDALDRHRVIVAAVERELRRLSGAVEIAISDPGAAREVNGKHRHSG